VQPAVQDHKEAQVQLERVLRVLPESWVQLVKLVQLDLLESQVQLVRVLRVQPEL
jgi:hypothetical protein